ncbi:hypothetical protein [Mitsuaria sp. 7]|uniref:hypothetical protein n=1 Tax=Mitsuaria sp. 7 TaxID=1658665 RepID=UPI0012F7A5B3|nr:hypothetical protein [Mitsuaria sp. 7]
MDNHPTIFAAPTSAGTWIHFAEQSAAPDEHEERVLDQATGRIVQVIRSAQDRTPSDFDMQTALDAAKAEGYGDMEPDPAVLALAAEDESDEEVATMARAMSLYKTAITMGMADGSELHQTIESSFSALPAETPFMKELLETAKRIVLIDLDHAMRAQ